MPLLCYMNHEEHGSMPVYDAEQRKEMKKTGWSEESEKEYLARRKKENVAKMNESDGAEEDNSDKEETPVRKKAKRKTSTR